jgi:mannose-1-phosphate guanylyltransferase
VESEFISHAYTDCANISIDYGVMEKTDRAWISPVQFRWNDVGTWESLYNIIPKKDQPEQGWSFLYGQTAKGYKNR